MLHFTGMSVVLLVPLARSLVAWLELPSLSRWLLRTIRLGYAIQFPWRPPKFRGIWFTSVKTVDAPDIARQYQLPRFAGSTPCPEPPRRAPSGQGRSGPYRQHGDHCAYQPVRQFTSHRMSQLARHLLLWSQKHLRSLHAIHIPGVLNLGSNILVFYLP